MPSEPALIVVVGSLNMDFVVRVQTLPRRGETARGRDLLTLPGGKGANQAFAVGKLGGRGAMIGCVGADSFGTQLRSNLENVGVDTSYVSTVETTTGVALIEVDETGENRIVVVGGANELLTPLAVTSAIKDLASRLTSPATPLVLLQLETPLVTVTAAAALAKSLGWTVILDPAPAQPLSAELSQQVTILTPNESESLALLNREGDEIALSTAPEIVRELLELGVSQVILKLGANGAFWADKHGQLHLPTQRVNALDTTAAGDCFNGALAVALAEGRPISEAITFANRAAAIAVTRRGAQASIPTRAEVCDR